MTEVFIVLRIARSLEIDHTAIYSNGTALAKPEVMPVSRIWLITAPLTTNLIL
jgi:hypothetical protein